MDWMGVGMMLVLKTVDSFTGKTLKLEVPRGCLHEFCQLMVDQMIYEKSDMFAVQKLKESVIAGDAKYEGAPVVVV